ncbi:MAG TPA: MFS transporter, partial [Dehalococcoidia bacterium]|nr:MFS transporter [Dehalococcoidia bacterium]
LAWFILREPAQSGQRPRFDPWGALTLSSGLLCLMAAINQGHRIGWTSPAILGLAAAALVLLGLFLIVETKVPEPAVDLRLFKNRTFSVYNAILVTFFIPSSSMPFLLPFYLIQSLGAPSAVAGLFLTVIPLLMFILSPGTGTLSDRIGPWVMTTSGLAFQVAGYFLVSRIGEGFSVLQTLLGLGVLGIGAGLFLTPVYSAVMGATPPDRMGLSSALIATLRGIGTTTGQAVAATSLAMRREFHESALPAGLDNLQRVRQGLALGFRDTILILATVAVLGFLIALTLARPRGGQQPTQKELAEARSD